mmetsp:Transcript_21968/g.32448  ORF Transcript_21968/g.32448 Transcript_21968/m.32448 type:complete len:483 (+) Transcript_21968:54-1502(+)
MMMSRSSSLLLFFTTIVLVTTTNAQVNKNTQHEFADQVTPLLYANTDTTDNDCSSAFGISMAMDLIYPTTRDDSKTQVQELFGYSDDQSLQWTDTQANLNSKYLGNCLGSTYYEECSRQPWVMIKNSVWTHNKLDLRSDYNEIVGDFIQSIDFEDQSAGSHVNEWVKESTEGLIEKLVKEGPLSPWVSLVMNTIYFKASWRDSFDETKTTRDPFFTADGSTKTADFMHQVTHLPHWHHEEMGRQVLELPFTGSDISMYISLSTDPRNMLASKSLVKAIRAGDRFQDDRRVAVALPKFQFFSTYEGDNFIDTMKQLGITGPFDGGLCFYDWNDSNECREYIEYMIQKTYISIDEDGVEAAAVTAFGIGITSIGTPEIDTPLLFLANRPFQFFIYDKKEDVMLFEGFVRNPGLVEDDLKNPSSAAISHAASDFWKDNFAGVNPEEVIDGTYRYDGGGGNSGGQQSHYYSRVLMFLTLAGLWIVL